MGGGESSAALRERFEREQGKLAALDHVDQRLDDGTVELRSGAGLQLCQCVLDWGAGGPGPAVAAVGVVGLFTVPLIVGE